MRMSENEIAKFDRHGEDGDWVESGREDGGTVAPGWKRSAWYCVIELVVGFEGFVQSSSVN